MEFSHHSSNPLEARKSDLRNASYKAQLHDAEAAAGYDESSDDPLAMTIKQQKYINHVRETLGADLFPPQRGGPSDITPKPGVSRAAASAKAQFVDLDASDDELALVDAEQLTYDAKKVIKVESPRPYHWHTRHVPLDIAEDEEDPDDIKAEEYAEDAKKVIKVESPRPYHWHTRHVPLDIAENEEDPDDIKAEEYAEDPDAIKAEEYADDQEGDFFTGERFPDDDEDMLSIGDDSRLGSLSPLTPLSSNQSSPYSSPQSSRPASPDEEATLLARPAEEQAEIQEEIAQLCDSVPDIAEEYRLIDRLGTGTFSSVYKAVDVHYGAWDNQAWLGRHPAESTAYYQSAGPGYKGRGGRAPGWRQAGHQMDEDREDSPPRNVYVAIKRIYTTSGPERIRNELSIMEACRGCRHTSQIITAFRNEDQVVIVLPYQRNMDFRDFYQTLHPEGIKCYLRCLFRALRDIHARGIIHRDVKPANFLYDPFTGIGTLCDFGLASRLETTTPHTLGRCYHTPATAQDPHGKNRPLDQYETAHIKQAQKDARAKSAGAPEKVGYPEQDRRPLSKANRAGTRGFRAPEVLLKCSAQTGAIDVWSAGIILLFFLTGKFPIFQSNDDIEGLMEIAIIIGRKKIEKVATLHGRTLATNVPELDQDGISWEDFVERLNPDIWKPRKYDMRFYPHNSKHRDGRGSTSTSIPAPEPTPTPSSPAHAPPSTDPSSAPSDAPPPHLTSDRHLNPPSAERHTRELRLAFHFLEQVLHVESTKRYTPRKALYHNFLDEAGVDGDDAFAPHPVGGGVCGTYHHLDARGVHWARVLSRCGCGVGRDHPMGLGDGEEEGDGEGSEEEGEGHVVEEEIELQAGEGVPIGQNPCEYHRNL